jgi:two-component system phosphate regulon sensor histidine kinase PhoR
MAWTRQHQLQELVEQTLRGEKMPPLYLTFHNRYLEAHARSIKKNKQRVAVALAVHDVTELQHLTRVRRDFVANISHELRTPVASIQLLSDTLLSGALDDNEVAPNLVDKIATQAEVLSQLAQELMDLSLIESGQAPLRLGTYSFRDIAQAQIDRLLPQAERKGLTLNLNLPDDVDVLVDEAAIGRVLGNLLHNAIKFTNDGQVKISALRTSNGVDKDGDEITEDWVLVRVEDTGVGIPPHELERIFERFYKIDRARTGRKSGTGLGLAIAKHVVEAHGGQIWAESAGGTGTVFYFTLPVEEKNSAEEA